VHRRRSHGSVRPSRSDDRHPSETRAPLNRLLAGLPFETLARLSPHLERVDLHRTETLFRVHEPLHWVYFPDSAVVSLVSTLQSGQSLEVGVVGYDGLAGTAIFPGGDVMTCAAIVLIEGGARRIAADVMRREVPADGALCSMVARYIQTLLVRSMHLSLCNVFHSVEQRCVRWLLTIGDLTDDGEVPVTHDTVAAMLGVHRPTVTPVLHGLDTAGLIVERRGRIAIRDRGGLEQMACECYALIRDAHLRLLGT
jgi:CRP-like cAMP-binding protein